MFSGDHPLLHKAYSPMTIRFFILQTHYRSTLDFSNEALQAAEKGLKRLWEAYEHLKKLAAANAAPSDRELDAKVRKHLAEADESINDDFNTAKVLASLFELVPIINSIKDKHIPAEALGSQTIVLMQKYFEDYLEKILGLKSEHESDNSKLANVLDLLIDLRRDARAKKDYATSDKIRNQLSNLGIQLKDEKDGGVSYSW
jgi:cysteinyl-tRNA synthetase